MAAHSDRAHALLSASGAERWLNCTPSPRLEEIHARKTSSVYAAEGTLAHEFADVELRYFNGEITEEQYHVRLGKLRRNKLYTDEMEPQTDKYVQYVKDAYHTALKTDSMTVLSVEERLDFSQYVPEGFGTGDAVIVQDNQIHVIDLKYGKGVPVSAVNNSQLKLYGLGALLAYDVLYDIGTVVLTIVQPRLDSISDFVLTADNLITWAKWVEDRAQMAFKGEGEQVAGDWCRWCKIKATCKAFSGEKHKVAIEEFGLAEPAVISDDKVLEIYGQIKQIKAWVKAVEDYVRAETMAGKKFKGYKLVESTAKRKWLDEDKVLESLYANGFKPEDVTKTKLKGILAIEQLLSKDGFLEKLGHLVVKPQGAPLLVPEHDPRPALGGVQSAIDDFL